MAYLEVLTPHAIQDPDLRAMALTSGDEMFGVYSPGLSTCVETLPRPISMRSHNKTASKHRIRKRRSWVDVLAARPAMAMLKGLTHNPCTRWNGRAMKGTRFAQFSTEVLRRGAAAVLPQHLPDRWLDALLEEADLLAPEAWDSQEEDRVHECCAGLLGAVLVVLMEQRGHPDQLEVAVGTLMSHLHCYILALAAERVSRDTDIWLEPPTLANLFDAERKVRGQRRAAEGS